MLATLSLEWVASMHLESDKGQTLERGDKGLDQEVHQVPDTMTAATTTIPKCTQQPNQAQESNMVMMKDQLTWERSPSQDLDPDLHAKWRLTKVVATPRTIADKECNKVMPNHSTTSRVATPNTNLIDIPGNASRQEDRVQDANLQERAEVQWDTSSNLTTHSTTTITKVLFRTSWTWHHKSEWDTMQSYIILKNITGIYLREILLNFQKREKSYTKT